MASEPARGPLFVHVPLVHMEEALPRLRALHLQPEVALSAQDLESMRSEHLMDIGEALHRSGLDVTVHAPHDDLNPGSTDPLMAKATRRRFRQSLMCARHLGARLLVFHPGFDPWRYGFTEEVWLERSLRFWPPILAEAEDLGLSLALENVFDTHPRPLLDLLSRLASPRLGCCFDIGHWQLFHHQPLSEWLHALAPHLVHLHLHDNHGQRDDHLPLGHGRIDFASLFVLLEQLDLCPSMTLEMRSLEACVKSLPALRSLGLRRIGEQTCAHNAAGAETLT